MWRAATNARVNRTDLPRQLETSLIRYHGSAFFGMAWQLALIWGRQGGFCDTIEG
jgi:hypothetical protein